jgi:hypothetical protein
MCHVADFSLTRWMIWRKYSWTGSQARRKNRQALGSGNVTSSTFRDP